MSQQLNGNKRQLAHTQDVPTAKRQKRPRTCTGLWFSITEEDVQRIRRRQSWINSVKHKEVVSLMEYRDEKVWRVCSVPAEVQSKTLCARCKLYRDLLILFKMDSVVTLDAVLTEHTDEFQHLHIHCDLAKRTVVASNIGIVASDGKLPVIFASFSKHSLRINTALNQNLYQSRCGAPLSKKSVYMHLKQYLSDTVILCRGFERHKQWTAQSHGATFKNALWLPNQWTRHQKCEVIVASRFSSKSTELCSHCKTLKATMSKATSVRENYVPSIHAPFQRLPASVKQTVHQQRRKELKRIRAMHNRLKKRISLHDAIEVSHRDTNLDLYELHKFIYDHFDELSAGADTRRAAMLTEFMKDQLKSLVQDNKPSKDSSKGMRWSLSTFQFAVHLAVRGGSKTFSRINDLGIIKLPSNRTMKLKRLEFQTGQGVTPKLINNMAESLSAHRHQIGRIGEPFLVLKWDEIYIKNGFVWNPKSGELLGVTTNLESEEYLQPLYDLCYAVENDKNADKEVLQQYSSKIVVQTKVCDLASNWDYVSAFWMFHDNAVAAELYNCFVFQLLYPMHLKSMDIRVMVSDQSSTNLSFVQLLMGGKTSSEMIGVPLEFNLPFYAHSVVFVFDPQHCFKALRNALYHSKQDRLNLKSNTYPLQDLLNPITWEHIEEMHNEDLHRSSARYRTLTNASVYLNPWSKQRVSLALDVFHETVVSGLQERQKQDRTLHSTLQYIRMVRHLLVGTMISRSKSDGKFDRIWGGSNALLDRMDAAWKWFDDFRKTNPQSSLSTKTMVSVSSIRFGVGWICAEFERCYEYLRVEDRPYLCPFRITTNDLEMLFSKQRGRGSDRAGMWSKGVSMERMKQDLRLNQNKPVGHFSNSNTSVRERNRRKRNSQ